MHILIVKLGSIGDVIHTLPALAAIKRALPRANVSWVVERRAAEILRGNPLLERVIEIDTRRLREKSKSLNAESNFVAKLRGAQDQFRELRETKFDVAIDFQGLIKSSFVARLSGAKRRYGFDAHSMREPAGRFLLTDTFPVSSGVHVVEKNLALAARALNISVPKYASDFEFPISITTAHQIESTEATQNANDFAILNVGGGWPTKLWSAARFSQLADGLLSQYSLRSLVTHGGGSEKELAESIVAGTLPGAAQAVNLSLKSFYSLAQRARVYVGGDTGPTHLAVAAGAPIVGLFGPTEWWRNGSPRRDDICVERNDIGCRENCHRRQCANWICMDIETERVLASIGERMRRAERARDAGILIGV